MKKTIMFLGVLSLGLAHAQQNDPYDGKVGINTETPTATLNVKSKTGTTASTKNFELENANGTKMVTVLDDGKTGIGTDQPKSLLHIHDTAIKGRSGNIIHSSSSTPAYRFAKYQEGSNYANGYLGQIQAYSFGHLDDNKLSSSIIFRAQGTHSATNAGGNILFTTVPENTLNTGPRMLISHNGEVLIGPNWTDADTRTGAKFKVARVSTFANEAESMTVGYGADLELPSLIKGSNTKDAVVSLISSWGGNRENVATRIDFGAKNTSAIANSYIAFRTSKGGAKDATVEQMRIIDGKVGIGTTEPTHKLHIKANADPLKLEGLQAATGTNTQNLVVENGVVKVSAATPDANVKLGTGTSKPCNSANAGTINYEEITKDGKKTGVFGFCMKRNDNEYVWAYMVGGTNPFGTSANGANFADGIKD